MPSQEELEAAMISDGERVPAKSDKLDQLIALGAKMSKAIQDKKRIEQEEKDNKALIAQLSEIDIPKFMAELQISTIGLPNGQTIIINDILSAKMPDKNKEPLKYKKCVEWLDDHGIGDIVKRQVVASFGKDSAEEVARVMEAIKIATNGAIPVEEKQDVNYQTLNATLKEEKRKGRAIPKGDDGFEIFVGPRAQFAK